MEATCRPPPPPPPPHCARGSQAPRPLCPEHPGSRPPVTALDPPGAQGNVCLLESGTNSVHLLFQFQDRVHVKLILKSLGFLFLL